MVMFNCDPTFENNNLNSYIVFSDAPYEVLNDYKFDVKNVKVDTNVPGFCGPKTEITFDVVYKNEQEKTKCFNNWFEDIYAPCCGHTGFKPYYADKATLYLYNGDNVKLLRKIILWKVYPIEIINEHCKDWSTISFRATPISVEDLTEEEKKMNDKTELNSILNKVQPYVKLISELDEVEKYIDENKLPSSFESIGKEFVESLHRYNSVLKNVCVDIMKQACK